MNIIKGIFILTAVIIFWGIFVGLGINGQLGKRIQNWLINHN